MISRRVDLTENGEFCGGRFDADIPFLILDEPLTRDDFIRWHNINNNRIMSTDEYEELLKLERMFGRKNYYTEIMDVFHMDEESFRIEMETHCQRCGKELKTPWNNFYGLCKECDKDMVYNPDNRKKFPWSPVEINRVAWGNEGENIFLLR